jgi:hypothetical protein
MGKHVVIVTEACQWRSLQSAIDHRRVSRRLLANNSRIYTVKTRQHSHRIRKIFSFDGRIPMSFEPVQTGGSPVEERRRSWSLRSQQARQDDLSRRYQRLRIKALGPIRGNSELGRLCWCCASIYTLSHRMPTWLSAIQKRKDSVHVDAAREQGWLRPTSGQL